MSKKRGFERDSFLKISLNKKGQVTLFILVAIMIVAGILFYYFYLGPQVFSEDAQMPKLDRCINTEVQIQIEKLSLKAGVLNPTFKSMYLDENYTFICYTSEYYKPCAVQYPFLKDTFEKSLAAAIKPKIQECYDNAVDDLISRGKEVKAGNIQSTVSIDPNGVNVLITAPTTIGSEGASKGFVDINVNVYSPIYEIIMIANSILQFESSYGDSDVASFMFYYPEITVQKIRRDDSVKLYIVTDKKDIKYRFASRSYAWPPGYGDIYD